METSSPELEPVGGEYERLCLQVGHLFIMFGRLEGTLSSLLRLQMSHRLAGGAKRGTTKSKESVKIAAAVYGSMRFQAARDTIKRLMDIQNLDPEHREGVDSIFIQMGHIQALRDALAHQQIFKAYKDKLDVWYLSDVATTRAFKTAHFRVFHLSAIAHATADLDAATHLFGSEMIRREIIAKPARFAEPQPWQYKPSMLVQTHHSTLLQPLAPERQQPA